MSDFISEGWSLYVAIATIASIVACALLLQSQSSRRKGKAQVDTTGHVWDEDLAEWNNPLPRWWMWLFYLTIVFGLAYLVLYPGLGSYQGYLSWTSAGQFRAEQQAAAATYGPATARFVAQDIRTVAANAEAREMGQRLFLNYCSQCHGSDAGGSRGFPSLKDRDWLYGGDPDTIKASITDGRSGTMPPMGGAVGNSEDVRDVAHHVLRLAGRTYDDLRAHRGKQKFESICAACHGADGKGNSQLGAPNLTDDIWLHGGSEASIVETITKGRKGAMPAHRDFLDAGKIHLLTAYVYGLSAPEGAFKAP
ncbi:MAG TPA: cytochrome-c oxidase, cbb3-type subunit III [Burkholderiales bacterium]|nr:cytochrome-c oxidase, cbb3-type subunit III [Burkholderiales bacterium]